MIGVSNPPIDGALDTVTNLNDIAEAGGTDSAFIIETGNADDTAAAFKTVIDSIREEAVSCEAEIPENPGGAPFDKDKVNVSFTKDGETMNLGYDPDCEGENAWRYDDEDEPTADRALPGHLSGNPGRKRRGPQRRFRVRNRPRRSQVSAAPH